MKIQHRIVTVSTLLIITACALTAFKSADVAGSKNNIQVRIDNRVLSMGVDSLAITTAGTLKMDGFRDETAIETIKFRIQIKHNTFAGANQLFPWIEEYNGGQEFTSFSLEELWKINVKVGDELMIIPVGIGTKYRNAPAKFQLHIVRDRC